MEIEKNVPMPKGGWSLKNGKYGFLTEMQIGDSVLDGKAKSSARSNVYAAAKQYQFMNKGSDNHVRFSAKRCHGGVRIWRIA